jgi:hypothetical protein
MSQLAEMDRRVVVDRRGTPVTVATSGPWNESCLSTIPIGDQSNNDYNRTMTIEDKTGIVVEAVANGVILQASEIIDTTLDDRSLLGYLVGHAEATYQANARFRKQINSNADHGNRGRDTLWSFMQHWLASKLLKDNNNPPIMRRLLEQSGFANGSYLPG